MAQTIVLEETQDSFNGETGEITNQTKRTVKKTRIEPTDEYFKVSRYLHTIFAYHGIPLRLVGISLVIAQRMQFKTNMLYLLKEDKEEIAAMLDVSIERVRTLIKDCKKYDIIRPTGSRGKYEVNGYLFSTGDLVDTRNIQAHFDFDADTVETTATMQHKITGETVRKAVSNKALKQIPGQMSLDLPQES